MSRNMKLMSGVGRGDTKEKEKQDRKEKLCKMEKDKKEKGPLTVEDGTGGLSLNVGSKLPQHAP